MQESWAELPSEPDAVANLPASAEVQWPAADAALPPQAVIVRAVTAAASGQASRSLFRRVLMNIMVLPLSSRPSADGLCFAAIAGRSFATGSPLRLRSPGRTCRPR